MRKSKVTFSNFWKKGLSIALACVMTVSMMPAFSAAAASTVTGTTSEQPFASGTGGSTNFRIPALYTLNDGSLLAAADARWNHMGDAAGLDTLVSRSVDGGKNWNYSLPNYFDDSTDAYHNLATAFIDPAVTEGADGTLYMLVDLWPGGVALNTAKYTNPAASTGYVTVDGVKRLALYASPIPAEQGVDSNYTHYVGDFGTDGYAPVYAKDTAENAVYYVDKYYYLYDARKTALTCERLGSSGTQVNQNVFYYNAALHVRATSHLWMTSSKDKGSTWSEPALLNDQVRTGNDNFYGVGPGRGLTTSTGRIIFPCYTWKTGFGDGNTSLIYSDDNGATWNRTADMSNQSSEATLVEADGKIYLFARHGGYYVSEDNGTTWSARKGVDGISYTTSCQINAITYSKKIDGKTAILLSAPTSGRTTGKIFTGLVQEDGTIRWEYTYSVNGSGSYAYSCLTELEDGSIGLLYEGGNNPITFTNIGIEQIAPNAEIDGVPVKVKLDIGQTYTRTYNQKRQSDHITVQPDRDVATAEVTDEVQNRQVLYSHSTNTASSLDSFSSVKDSSISLEEAEFTITGTGTEGIYTVYNEAASLYLTNASYASTFFTSDSVNNIKITPTEGSDTFRICKEGGNRFVIFYYTNMDFNSNSEYSSDFATGDYEIVLLEKQEALGEDDVIPGYRRVSQVTSGKKYLISYIWTDGSVIVLYPSNGTGNQTKLVGAETSALTTVRITGTGNGSATAVIDDVTYQITVGTQVTKVNLEPGESYVIEGSSAFTVTPDDVTGIEVKGSSEYVLNDFESVGAFSETANRNAKLADAEFVFTAASDTDASEDTYTIYNEKISQYLVNTNASSYYSTAPANMSLELQDQEEGAAFRIANGSSYSKDVRHMCFYYPSYVFDSMSVYSETLSGSAFNGTYDFVLLEKQDIVSGTDVIPGYARASNVTSGKSYLITCINDGKIIVLYPNAGQQDRTKCFTGATLEKVIITAKTAGASATVQVGEEIYEVSVSECSHQDTSIQGVLAAACETAGYTGDKVCTECGEILEKGEEIPPLGHDWDDGTVTIPVSPDRDGVMTYTCKRDSNHTKTELIPALDYMKENLDAECKKAEGLLAQTDVYTADSLSALKDACDAAKNAAANATLSEINALYGALVAAQENLVTIKDQEQKDARQKLSDTLKSALNILNAGQGNYTADSWNTFKAACEAAQNPPANASAAELNTLAAVLQKAQSGLSAEKPQKGIAAPGIKSVKANAGKKQVTVEIKVNLTAGADRYQVYRVANGKTTLVGTTKSGKAAVTDTKLKARKASYYAVALSADGKQTSAKGASKSITMAKGIKIKKVSAASGGLCIKWPKMKKATKYVIYRSTKKSGGFKRIAIVSGKRNLYTDRKTKKGKNYYYKIAVRTKTQVSLISAASKKAKR